jgi:uncharacterized protein (DUF1501 family)
MSFSRREFLGSSALALASFSLPDLAWAAAADTGRILVVIQLAGGNDGVNTLVPHEDPLYRTLRPSVAWNEQELIALPGQKFALPSTMGKLQARFAQGQVAIVQGVGYPNPNRSHFESTATWQTARLNPVGDATGWLGRTVETNSALAAPLLTLGVGGGGLSPTLYSSRVTLTSVMSLDAFAVQPDRRYPADAPALNTALRALYTPEREDSPLAQYIRQTGLTALDASNRLAGAVKSYNSMIEFPKGAFGDQLKLISQLSSAGLGTRLFHLTLGSFDTHAGQKKQHAGLLGQLSDGIAALLSDAEAHGFADRLLVMTYSEFGRRVQENASGGTDHGAGSVVLLAGHPVNGGLHGPTTNLAQLTGGDIPGVVDFRSVYGTVLRGWLNVAPERVLGGRFNALPLLRGQS